MDSALATPSHKRASIGTYVAVFLVLAVITAIEVGLSYLNLAREVRTPVFLGLSLAKAGLVAAFYMHLRQEPRFYTIILLVPVPLFLLFAVLMAVT